MKNKTTLIQGLSDSFFETKISQDLGKKSFKFTKLQMFQIALCLTALVVFLLKTFL